MCLTLTMLSAINCRYPDSFRYVPLNHVYLIALLFSALTAGILDLCISLLSVYIVVAAELRIYRSFIAAVACGCRQAIDVDVYRYLISHAYILGIWGGCG